MPSTIVWLNERLAIMLEIVAGVIGKKIVEQAGLCYFRTTTVSQRGSCRPCLGISTGQQGGQKAILMKP
jgi:hypothetical protein